MGVVIRKKETVQISVCVQILCVVRVPYCSLVACHKILRKVLSDDDIRKLLIQIETTDDNDDIYFLTTINNDPDTARVNSQSLWSLTNDKQPSEGNSFDFIFLTL